MLKQHKIPNFGLKITLKDHPTSLYFTVFPANPWMLKVVQIDSKKVTIKFCVYMYLISESIKWFCTAFYAY